MPFDECRCCGGVYHWLWVEAFDKFGFGDGDSQVETEQVENALIDAGYVVKSATWGLHNTIITSIQKNGLELMPSAESDFTIGYCNPRDYLPEEVITFLDDKFPDIKGGCNHEH